MGQLQISRHFVSPPVDTPRVSVEGATVQVAAGPEEKSTGMAMLLSAVVPGAGQVYAERYISIPIIWGFGVYFGKTMADQNKLYQDFASQYAASIVADTLSGRGSADLRRIRDFYRDQRDQFAVYLGLTYLLNIVDAYVGAALYGFDVSPDLSGGARIRYRMTVR
ncbi:MAG: DUF5683 domain-containing protein [Bacteroidetes bacterium]|jgi:hypothetical protein|nr:DUF5683 domain-containing protein [Bacteroidota bacterium]